MKRVFTTLWGWLLFEYRWQYDLFFIAAGALTTIAIEERLWPSAAMMMAATLIFLWLSYEHEKEHRLRAIDGVAGIVAALITAAESAREDKHGVRDRG